MVGNRFAADSLARDFQKRIASLKSIKKQASAQPEQHSHSEEGGEQPEDFLVAPSEAIDIHSNDLNDKIKQVSSYADDEVCSKCNSAECKCDAVKENEAKDKSCESCGTKECVCDNSISYLIDHKANHVLSELGKISKGLRSKNQGFAADVVEATALEIKNDLVKKAGLKLEIIMGLQKLARAAHKKGDFFAGDMIYATIEEVKDSE